MSFGFGRGVAEKQWNWPYPLKRFEYFDKIMYKHCYWRELDRGVANCHLSSVEAMPREVEILKTSESDTLSFWNMLIYICSNSEKKENWKGYYTFSYVKKKVQTHLAVIFCV